MQARTQADEDRKLKAAHEACKRWLDQHEHIVVEPDAPGKKEQPPTPKAASQESRSNHDRSDMITITKKKLSILATFVYVLIVVMYKFI